MKLRPVTLALLALASASTMAAEPTQQTQPVQLSVPNKNFPNGNVEGGRLVLLYGQTDKVSGVDFALFGLSDVNQFKGLQFGFFGANRNRVDMTGAQLGLVNWNDNTATGASLGLMNYTGGAYTGAQFGLLNLNQGPLKGAQLGFVNFADNLTGLQFGLINGTNHIEKGVQIGLINYDKSGTFVSKDLPVFPIINGRF